MLEYKEVTIEFFEEKFRSERINFLRNIKNFISNDFKQTDEVKKIVNKLDLLLYGVGE